MVEFLKRLQSFPLIQTLAAGNELQQGSGNWIARCVQLMDPILHHVYVTQLSQLPE